MTRVRQFAVTAFCGVFLAVGLIGCTHDRPDSVGSRALLAVSGNKTLTYSAPSDGMVTVQDARNNEVTYAGRIQKGETIVVDTENNRVTVGGRIVSQKMLNGLHEHRVFFEPTEMVESSSSVTHTTKTESSHSTGTVTP